LDVESTNETPRFPDKCFSDFALIPHMGRTRH
jgi:hypothetical protein